MRVIIFDTETSGLPLLRNSPITKSNEWPHILQLSYIVFDDETYRVIEEINDYIKIDNTTVITEGSSKIHNITYDYLNKNGIPIIKALDKFIHHLLSCDIAVGHNVLFDKKMVLVECNRHNISIRLDSTYCTMLNGINTCAIPQISKYGQTYFKYPKLSELHNKLFNHDISNLHDASIDILVCLRCYCMLRLHIDICDKNRVISNRFKKIMIK